MTLDQFRTKWGLVFSSLLIYELITRIDSSINTPLTAAGNELADDLHKLLAAGEKSPAANTPDHIGFPRRFVERPDGDSKGGER